MLTRNYIKLDNEIYFIVRKLRNTTTEEQANLIHEELNTNKLLKDNQGNWYCCHAVLETQYRDIDPNELVNLLEESQEETVEVKKKPDQDFGAYTKNNTTDKQQTIDTLI
jgi:hypothetical protein